MTVESQTVDVTYRGLKVATGARFVAAGPGAGFVEVDAPLPVGTRLVLSGELAKEVRVTGVVEQEAGTKTVAGMRLGWAEPAAKAEAKPAVAEAEKDGAEPDPGDSASLSSPPDDATTTGGGESRRRRRRKNASRS
jgi:hypothetical protein